MRCKNNRSMILDIKFKLDMGLYLQGRELSTEGFLRSRRSLITIDLEKPTTEKNPSVH